MGADMGAKMNWQSRQETANKQGGKTYGNNKRESAGIHRRGAY
jgi:hypothetical protein